ncbi:ChaN family lipoprotein [Tateyamaria sp.]|uniref:ChaN family lipoprotein n=1 Tax=Tateyamaria sp. TaxID=1929288 RepID=UPI00329D836D
MKHVIPKFGLAAAAFCASVSLCAASIEWSESTADVLVLGENHDNPTHHARQKNAVNEIQPKAVVFEMLTPQEAALLADVPRDVAAMEAASAAFHWNNIADYAGVLSVSSVIVGAALSRDDMRAAFSDGAVSVFGEDAEIYGLTGPLPKTEQATRETLQFDAHCAAMPREMMGGMVQAQRLRDAAFARTVIEAIDTYGLPVVLITGNGHARTDWGVPTYLARVRPNLNVESVGQGERGNAPTGVFSSVITDAPAPDRGNPCDAFKTSN